MEQITSLLHEFVTHEICNIKHEEVKRLEERMEDMKKAFNGKLDRIMTLLITLLITVIGSLVSAILAFLVMRHDI